MYTGRSIFIVLQTQFTLYAVTDVLLHAKTSVKAGTNRKQLFPMCPIHTAMQSRATLL